MRDKNEEVANSKSAILEGLCCLKTDAQRIRYQGFFNIFITFRKLFVIQLILAIKTQTIYQTKNIVHVPLLVESIFKNASEKVEKSDYENPIF